MSTDLKINFAFFGSSRFSVLILDGLEKAGLVPKVVVTTPDTKQGRKMILTPTPVKVWAQARKITVYAPEKLDEAFVETMRKETEHAGNQNGCVVYVVASYGKIIPASIFDLPPRKTLNVHPSLLPKLRGASPLQSAILDNMKDTGVTIIRIDEKMDHGPIIEQEDVTIEEWPIYEDFEAQMASEGAALLAQILPDWIDGEIGEEDQIDRDATFTRKITKEDGLINFDDDPYLNFRKIQAFHEWPQAYFFIKHKGQEIRVKITQASFQYSPTNDVSGKLIIEKVIPEGSKEMDYESFQRGYLNK